jgi:hypothetical protein
VLYVANVIGEDLLPATEGRDVERRNDQTYYFPPERVDDDEDVYVQYGDERTGVSVLILADSEDDAYDAIVRAYGPGNFEQVDDGPQPAVPQLTRGELLHKCDEFASYVLTDGALGHGWECGLCGRFLQAG